MNDASPRDIGFRSDVRPRLDIDDLMRIYRGLPTSPDVTKTPNLAMAVLERVARGASLYFPGHILNACEYHLVSTIWRIALPSRVAHWLYDRGYVDAEGEITEAGKQQFVSLTDTPE